ncbi:PDZ domain-containing protein [Calycomorphotria hydatis]|uniref:Serine endoprotease n=1 Tax=Calycomorphotria hydatis TaxID=2528027 RepID=A0A517TC31_9PLAN|nr:PDZ domain-containing protein [Calycomorphotria hydatis]QDT65924.1 serine endoprotease [Calycomorphotria hydatis]
MRRKLIALSVLLGIVHVVVAEDSLPPVVAPGPIYPLEKSLEQLSSPHFITRQNAIQHVSAWGLAAIPALEKMAHDNKPAQFIGALKSLEAIWLTAHARKDWETSDAVRSAFEEMSADDNTLLADWSTAILKDRSLLEDDKIIDKVRELGGVIEMTSQEDLLRDDGPIFRSAIEHLFLGPDWKGGEDGLKYIKRLPAFGMLYFTPQSGLTMEKLAGLRAIFPGLVIQRRGQTFLGVVADPLAPECRIRSVKPNSPAADAGIRPGDVIVTFNDVDIKNLQELVEAIEEIKPNEKVNVLVSRTGNPLNIEVTMRKWGK